MGLGPVGELTPERLRSVFASALRRYALAIEEDGRAGGIAFSSLLIGTDGGAFAGVTDSIHAIVRATVDVNRALKDAQPSDRIWIDKIEFIELYEDIATRAARAVQELPAALGAEFGSEVEFGCARRLDTPPGRGAASFDRRTLTPAAGGSGSQSARRRPTGRAQARRRTPPPRCNSPC